MGKHAEALKHLRWTLVDHDDRAELVALDGAIQLVEAIEGGNWQLVPKELPEEMRREGFAASNGKVGARALWRAMLAVAPKP